MSKPATTSRDWIWLTVVTAPVVGLVTFLVLAAISWQTHAAAIKPELLQRFPEQIVDAESPASVQYAMETSDEYTELYREMSFAEGALSYKYDRLLDILMERRPKQNDSKAWFVAENPDPRLLKYVDEFLEEAKPILANMQKLGRTGKQIWSPGGSLYVNQSGMIVRNWGYGDLGSTLTLEIMSAIQANDQQRLSDALDLLQRDGLRDYQPDFVLNVLPAGLTVPVWEQDQLDTVKDMMASIEDLQAQWRNYLHSRELAEIPWLLGKADADRNGNQSVPRIDAPSRRLAWLNAQETFSTIRIGTLSSLQKFADARADLLRRPKSSLDVALQFPVYGQQKATTNTSWYAEEYLKRSNQIHFARTAIALREYHLRNDAFPEHLSELTTLGLPEKATHDILDQPFEYQKTDQGCRLSNASMFFDPETTLSNSYQTPKETLTTVLDEYRQLSFR